MAEKVLLLAAIRKRNFGPVHREVGNVLIHESHIEKEGAVSWDFSDSGQASHDFFPHPEIRKGYFYNVADKAVTHAFDVEYITTADQIREKKRINDERAFFIDHLLVEHDLMSKEVSYDKALVEADRVERKERSRAGDVARATRHRQ